MFATLQQDSITISGVLLYYSDPSPNLQKKEVLPPGVLLAKDLERFAHSGSLPAFTFVSGFQEKKPPIFVKGFLQYENGLFQLLLLNGRTATLRFDEFTGENKRLCSDAGKNIVFPVLYVAENESKITYHRLTYFRKSNDGKELAKSWISALAVLFAPSTAFIMEILKSGRNGLLDRLSSLQNSDPKVSGRRGFYWLWWSCAKPRSLEDWVTQYWDTTVSNAHLQEIHNDLHPFRCGFYRIWLTDEKPEDEGNPRSVDLVWMTDHEWVQYRVDVIEGEDSSKLNFGSDDSHRAKLVIQNKIRVPYPNEGKMPGAIWDFVDKLGQSRAFIIPDNGSVPCPYSRALSSNDEKAVKKWMESRFGPGQDISAELGKKLDTDACISARQMFKS